MPKMFGAKFPLPELKLKLGFGAGSLSVPANSTYYLGFCDQADAAISAGTATDEGTAYTYMIFLVTQVGILKNLVCRPSSAAGVGESFVYTVRVNGVPTALTVTISGAAQVVGSDLVNTVKVVVGDYVTVQLVTSAAAATAKQTAALEFDTLSARTELINFRSGGTIAAALTRYLGSASRAGGATQSDNSNEAIYVIYVAPRKGTLKNLVVKSGAAAGAGQSFIYMVRVNLANTVLTLTISGAVDILAIDTTNVVQVDAGDYVTVRIVTSAAAAATTHIASLSFEEGDYRAG